MFITADCWIYVANGLLFLKAHIRPERAKQHLLYFPTLENAAFGTLVAASIK
jgi:hypothetical protein